METKPQKPSSTPKQTPENFVKDICRKTMKLYSSEQKILIVMEALRGEVSVAAIYRKHGTHKSLDKITPSDVYFGKKEAILKRRAKIKQQTLKQRRKAYLMK